MEIFHDGVFAIASKYTKIDEFDKAVAYADHWIHVCSKTSNSAIALARLICSMYNAETYLWSVRCCLGPLDDYRRSWALVLIKGFSDTGEQNVAFMTLATKLAETGYYIPKFD